MKLINIFLGLSLLFIFSSCRKENLMDKKEKELVSKLLLEPRDFKGMEIYAHRGHWNTAGSYENTLTSIRKAANIGVHGVELDVRISADSVLYLHHNPDVFENISFSSVSSKDIDRVILPNDDHIPRLDATLDLLKQYPKLKVNFELKGDIPAKFLTIYVRRINDLVMRSGIHERIFFSSLSLPLLVASKNYNAKIKTQSINYADFDMSKLVAAKVDMINFNYAMSMKRSELIQRAKENKIVVCSGAGKFVDVMSLLDRNPDVQMINTDEPDLVMQVYIKSDVKEGND